MNLNPSNRQRLLVIVTAIALGLLVLDRLVFTPLTNAWRKRSAEITKLQKNVLEGRGVIARAKNTQDKWADMKSKSLPDDPAQAEQELFSAFDKWGRSVSLELGSIKPQWKRGGSNRYSLLECRVDATGSIAALSRFLFEVEKSPLALRIDSFELNARDEFGQKLTMGLLVTGLRLIPLEGKQ